MTQFALTRGNLSRSSLIQKFLSRFEIGPFFLLFSLVVFVVLITIITLVFSTRQVTKGYLLSSLDAQHQDLVKIRELKDMEISKVRSLNNIQDSAKVNSMIKPRAMVYVDGNTALASK